MYMKGMKRVAEDPLERLLVEHVLECRLESRFFFHFYIRLMETQEGVNDIVSYGRA
jgi:hypothetical protein